MPPSPRRNPSSPRSAAPTSSRRSRTAKATSWGTDPLHLGAYSVLTPGGGEARAELAQPVDDRLFFAGEATSPDGFSTAHGAYNSGVAAIDAIKRALA